MPTAADNPLQTDQLLSQAEAAEYLGVTDRTVRSYIARGLLPAVRLNGSRLIRIRRGDVASMLTPVSGTEAGDLRG